MTRGNKGRQRITGELHYTSRMAHNRERIFCVSEFNHLHRDLEWSFKIARNINRKFETHRTEWKNQANREEEREVKEWNTQTLVNNYVKTEMAKLQETVRTQTHQIIQLQHLVNSMFMRYSMETFPNRQRPRAERTSDQNPPQEPDSNHIQGQSSQTGAKFVHVQHICNCSLCLELLSLVSGFQIKVIFFGFRTQQHRQDFVLSDPRNFSFCVTTS